MYQQFGQVLLESLAFPYILYIILGTALGLVVGVLPGLGGAVAIALLIPLTYGWDTTAAFLLLASITGATAFGGAITAILINTPGTANNAATVIDGYPMMQQGKGTEAIGIAGAASMFGSIIGLVLLLALLPIGREIILAFSYPELFMISAIGLATIALVSAGSMIKGLFAGALGVFLAFVGRSPVTGTRRFEFDTIYLSDGLPLVPVLVGLFAVSEAIRLIVRTRGDAISDPEVVEQAKMSRRTADGKKIRFPGFMPTVRQPRLIAQSSIIGTVVGIVPAVGGSVAGFVAYATAKQTVRDASKFGKGDPRGVMAVEASNDAKDGGAVLPTVMFGLPGSAAWAVMLGALQIHGVTPGRDMLTTDLDVTLTIISGLLVSSILVRSMGMLVAPWATPLIQLPTRYLGPVIYLLALVGALASRNRAEDILLVTVIGIVGYILKNNGFSLIPIVIGLVLGRTIEITLNQTLLVFGPSAFFTRPISLGIFIFGVVGIGASLIKTARDTRRQKQAASEQVTSDAGGGS